MNINKTNKKKLSIMPRCRKFGGGWLLIIDGIVGAKSSRPKNSPDFVRAFGKS
jgi:hypothetical protein